MMWAIDFRYLVSFDGDLNLLNRMSSDRMENDYVHQLSRGSHQNSMINDAESMEG